MPENKWPRWSGTAHRPRRALARKQLSVVTAKAKQHGERAGRRRAPHAEGEVVEGLLRRRLLRNVVELLHVAAAAHRHAVVEQDVAQERKARAQRCKERHGLLAEVPQDGVDATERDHANYEPHKSHNEGANRVAALLTALAEHEALERGLCAVQAAPARAV